VPAIRRAGAASAFFSAVAEQFALGAMPESGDLPAYGCLWSRVSGFRDARARCRRLRIADRLKLSVRSVSTPKSHVMQKMQMSNPSELLRYALSQPSASRKSWRALAVSA